MDEIASIVSISSTAVTILSSSKLIFEVVIPDTISTKYFCVIHIGLEFSLILVDDQPAFYLQIVYVLGNTLGGLQQY